jgi:hypothetical protein
MKYFYDTEFLEDGRTIELISIGILAEDGRELYLVNRDAPWKRIKKHEWLMANVVPKLPQPHGDWRNHAPHRWLCDMHSPAVQPREIIATAVRQFLADDGDVELWADYAAYDHVALCQLFGPMINLPNGIPMFTNDFQQEWRRAESPGLPEQAAGAHNAIEDARHLKLCFDSLTSRKGA